MADEPKDLMVIAKSTQRCNFSCKYCYNGSGSDGQDMNSKTLENLILNLSEAVKDKDRNLKRILWHGGEPLLVGLDFYKQALRLQKEHGIETKNAVQTNGSLLNEEFIDFLIENKVSIGISLDGTKKTHNKTRTYRNGEGTYDDVIRNIKLLIKKDHPFGTIMILNRYTAENPEEIYHFFRSFGIAPKINPLINTGRYKKNTEIGLSLEKCAETYNRYFDLFFDDPVPLQGVKPFEGMIEAMCGREIKNCANSGECFPSYVGIDSDGIIYPCARFCGVEELQLGNVNDSKDSLKRALESDTAEMFKKRKENLAECKKCEWEDICHGGCAFEAYITNGTIYSKDDKCMMRKKMYAHIHSKLKKEVEG